MPYWSLTILNVNFFFCWFTELQSYCLGIISVGVLGIGGEKHAEPGWRASLPVPAEALTRSLFAQNPRPQTRERNGGTACRLVLVVTGQSPHS